MNSIFDLLDNETNKRIYNGFFPISQLETKDVIKNSEIEIYDDIDYQSIDSSTSEMIQKVLIALVKQVNSIELSSQNADLKDAPVNWIINANSTFIDCMPDEKLLKANELFPVVTALDNVLWHAANNLHLTLLMLKANSGSSIRHLNESFYSSLSMDELDREWTKELGFWCSLLRIVQTKELNSKMTINIDAIAPSTPILELLLGDWEHLDNKYKENLSKNETEDLSDLINQRRRFISRAYEVKQTALEIAKRTSNSWSQFINLVNSLSKREKETMTIIIDDCSSIQKLEAINQYDAYIKQLQQSLREADSPLSHMIDDVDKRIEMALNYCVVASMQSTPFVLSPAILTLVKRPTLSFNYLLFSYHKLRIEPTLSNAKRFFYFALRCISKNFGVNNPLPKSSSLYELIEGFCTTVKSFYYQNEPVINELSFSDIQSDSIDIDGFSSFLYGVEIWEQEIDSEFCRNSGKIKTAIEEIFSGDFTPREMEESCSEKETWDNRFSSIESHSLARQIITSLSVVYLVYASLERIINAPKFESSFSNKDGLQALLRDLFDIDDKLIHKVYHSNFEVKAYRESKGMDTHILDWKENTANVALFRILQDRIEQVIQSVENQDIQHLLQCKQEIREDIRRCALPDLDIEWIDWLDSISYKLGKAFVNYCEKRADDFDEVKAKLRYVLGGRGNRLPPLALDTLATAEILYNRYATKEYAEKGFDYSSISALYYQAFEVAYNEMIWKPYVDVVNALIDGHYPRKGIYRDYFPGDTENDDYKTASDAEKSIKRYYFSEGRVKQYCVFGSFSHLLEEVKKENTAPKFCEHIASLSGYDTVTDMFQDDAFMAELVEFTNAIMDATDHRNEASHGGIIISVDQCRIDKEIVLSELEEVRNSNIGLIQHLLHIIKV